MILCPKELNANKYLFNINNIWNTWVNAYDNVQSLIIRDDYEIMW